MPLEIVRNDITRMHVDAIVNAANSSLLGGGGVDGAIHRAAGPQLLEECRGLNGCETGSAKVTKGYLLPARFVIHTVGPVWYGGSHGEEALLRSCYRTSLKLAKQYGCESVAFPLISAGIYGYPKDQAIRVATDTIADFLMENDMMVYLVVYDSAAFAISGKLFRAVQAYIDDNYVGAREDRCRERQNRMERARREHWDVPSEAACAPMREAAALPKAAAPMKAMSLEDALGRIDESFSQAVLRLIQKKGMKNADCYKRANLDKKLFSKLTNDVHYKPKKTTAVALAVALELTLPETRDLLRKAGFALSHSEKFDIIVEYFIENGQHNIFEINEVLFAYDQPLLGSIME